MNAPLSEKELRATLDTGKKQIENCIQGRISFDEFLNNYGAFYIEHRLDGHDANDAMKALLNKYAAEVALHQAIWNEVIIKVTSDEFISRPEVIQAGFIGHSEALKRLATLVNKHWR